MFNENPAAVAAVDVTGACTTIIVDPVRSLQVELIQAIRTKGAALRELLGRIESFNDDQILHAQATGDIDEMQRLQDADPVRWLADAKHSLQAGMMYAERAVAQPIGF